MAKKKPKKTVETLTHNEASRKNIPTAEFQSILRKDEQNPIRIAYERRNRDLDPQLVWRGKDEQDWSDLVVQAPLLYIQEKVHPKVLIDDLILKTKTDKKEADPQLDLFADFNGLPDEVRSTEFYQHDANWSNRMILGDSLQVMASLAEREGLRGKVQCIYIDPPYGIEFNSNFQWSTTSRNVRDGKVDHITREPEQVKAFRDTWRDGIHSYLTYLRDRLNVSRDLLSDSGSIFVQIGDKNVHLVKSLMDEIFGSINFINLITIQKTGQSGSILKNSVADYLVWYSKSENPKIRPLYHSNKYNPLTHSDYKFIRDVDLNYRSLNKNEKEGRVKISESSLPYQSVSVNSKDPSANTSIPVVIENKEYYCPPTRHWSIDPSGIEKVWRMGYIEVQGKTPRRRDFFHHSPGQSITNIWTDLMGAVAPIYVVQTNLKIVQRVLLMCSDPGDLILDPTCGSGTTAYVAEQWGRRWITIDTSRVALALARARIMGARYPYYLLADSQDGQHKEAEIALTEPSNAPTREDIRQGFVYERMPRITLKSIANNTEIDVIWEKFQVILNPILEKLNNIIGKKWEEWEIPRIADDKWSKEAKKLHKEWWQQRIARQKEIDASIAINADFEFLYDKPYEDKKKVRVAGPFTVESLSPHRVMIMDENDELIDPHQMAGKQTSDEIDFVQMIMENLKISGIQQAHKEDKINFTSIKPWPGLYICSEGRYIEGNEEADNEKRAAIFIGPEFGTVSRPDLVAAAREAGDADFDALIACAFNYDAHSSEFNKLGRIPVLKARMNADLHMADDLKNTGKGNLFVIFGEPDIDILDAQDDQIQVKINGIDVFHPNTGEVRSDGAEGIACWFIDIDYNEESFFVRHAYFLGSNDPYISLKTTLKAEINKDAWDTLNRDTSRPFDKPKSGRIAVKVINHLGDEVMKVFRVN